MQGERSPAATNRCGYPFLLLLQDCYLYNTKNASIGVRQSNFRTQHTRYPRRWWVWAKAKHLHDGFVYILVAVQGSTARDQKTQNIEKSARVMREVNDK